MQSDAWTRRYDDLASEAAQPPPTPPSSTILHNPPTCLSDCRSRPVDHPLLLERRLRRSKPRDGDAERRARHVVHPHMVAELHRRGLAPVLAADPDLQLVAAAAAQPHRELDQLAHAVLVEHLERIVLENTVLHVERQKTTGIVTRQAEGRLREIVGPEREEVGLLRDLVRGERGAR